MSRYPSTGLSGPIHPCPLPWTATVTDPETFTEPIIMPEFHWDWIPGREIKPYNCVVAE